MDIGEKLKNLRLKNDLTQEELADRAELSKGFISQVERGVTSPSIATLMDILECLGVRLTDFFAEDTEKIIFREADFFVTENEALQYEMAWLVPKSIQNNMEPVLITLFAKGESETYQPHSGEVFGFVLQGHITMIHGSKTPDKFKLHQHNSFYFKANRFYQFKNQSKEVAKILLLSSPPSF